jgi:hypothetical protein
MHSAVGRVGTISKGMLSIMIFLGVEIVVAIARSGSTGLLHTSAVGVDLNLLVTLLLMARRAWVVVGDGGTSSLRVDEGSFERDDGR